jgi:hypothetical protein
MNTRRSFLLAAVGICLLPGSSLFAAEAPAALTAADLAGRLSASRQDGNSYVRYKLDTAGGTLQIEGKERRGRGGTEAVYRVLWPKERKGEAILLKKGGGKASGTLFTPPGKLQPISGSEPFFGSDLSCDDVVDNFFAWDQQAIVGNESVDRVNCVVLESKPGKAGSAYGSVKSWIDPRRMVPLRVEKYSGSGQLVRRIDTTRVVTDDKRRHIPANLSVRGPRGSVTEIDGSKIKHDVKFDDQEFTPEGLKTSTGDRASAE